jgi:heme/copper-type cytochrome/quinol oxidase subunit 1
MGAVFAIFGAFYYWVEKMSGLKFDEQQGITHFVATFVGVNLTFFPMHFLGLQGMPRRIPDYRDSFYFWNKVASFGSFVTFAALLWFFYVIYTTFANTNITPTLVDFDADQWYLDNAKEQEALRVENHIKALEFLDEQLDEEQNLIRTQRKIKEESSN